MFKKIISIGRIFGGQYIYVIADLESLTLPQKDASNSINFPNDFLNISESDYENEIVIWGSGSKGVIFSTIMARLGKNIKGCIDIILCKISLIGCAMHPALSK